MLNGTSYQFCFFIFLFFTLSTTAQNRVNKDTILGNFYFNKINLSNLDSAYINSEKALFYLKNSKDWEKITACYFYLAAIPAWQGNILVSIDYTKKLLDISEEHFGKESRDYTNGLMILANNYLSFSDYKRAISIYEDAIFLYKKGEYNSAVLAAYYENLGLSYMEFGEYKSSINSLENALRLGANDKSSSLRSLGKSYAKIEDFYSAKSNFHKSLKILQDSTSQYDAQKKLDCFQGLAQIYLHEQKLDSTQYCLNQINKIHQKHQSGFMFDYHRFEIQAQLHAVQNNLNQATDSYNQAIQSTREEYKDFQKHHEIAQMFTKKAEFTHQYKTAKEALPLYQQALIQNARAFNEEDWKSNPNVEQFQNNSYALDALTGKAAVLFDIFQAEKDRVTLEKALETCELTSELIFQLRKDYRAEGSKLFLSDKVIPFYEKAIAIALALYEETQEEHYKSIAFQFAEANKSLLLLESIQKNEATKTTGIPDTLIDQEQELKFQIAFYEKSIAEEKQKKEGKVADNLSEMETTLFDLQEEYQGLLDTLKQVYPEFEQQSEELNLATVASIQNELSSSKSGVLEIFVGKESIYLFLIHRNGVETAKVSNMEAIRTATESLLAIINTAPKSQEFEKDFRIFEKEAHFLYQELLSPLFLKASMTPNQLTIIPDGFLSFLPFEILLSEPSETGAVGYNLENLNYLFENCLVHYNYSTSLFSTQRKAEKKRENLQFMGFAPSFGTKQIAESRDCIQNELYSLRCNQNEVEDISTLWTGESFLAEGATKSSFLTAANQSDILHLATHVCMNVDAPKTSKIFFTDGYLTPYDLTNLELNNQLTVLSACNTGSGKLLGGEGVLSLAREFTLAGSPSTLTSLWAIDDCSTSEMMNYYYTNLVNYQRKDEALQQAKITFLEKADKERAHPYYWAAFLQFGEVGALREAPFSMWWLVGIFGLIVLGLVFWKIKN